jgi:hypothetical protein
MMDVQIIRSIQSDRFRVWKLGGVATGGNKIDKKSITSFQVNLFDTVFDGRILRYLAENAEGWSREAESNKFSKPRLARLRDGIIPFKGIFLQFFERLCVI